MPRGILDRLADGVVLGDGGYLLELEKRGYVQAGPFTPEVVIGSPARRAALRPVFPEPATCPATTSSTSPGSSFARETACLIAWASIVTAGVMLKPPRADLASPVRA